MFHYREFPAKASVNPKDKRIQVNSPSECARKCDQDTNIHCRSFNFCPDSNVCYLSTRHVVDASQSDNTNLVCTHYSSKIRNKTNIFSVHLALYFAAQQTNKNRKLPVGFCVRLQRQRQFSRRFSVRELERRSVQHSVCDRGRF